MQTIYLDISNKGVIPCIQAKQGEVGRKFLAVITDNGVPYNIPDNSLLSVWYEGDTDAGNYSSIEEKSAFAIDGNKVVVELVAQMLLKPGNGELCLSVTHGDGVETNTWNIPYVVEYKPGAGSSVPTEYYTALTEAGAVAAKAATEAAKSAQQAQEAVDGYVKIAEIESYMLAYQQKKIPVGYTFYWSPVDGSGVDLSTSEKVHNHFGFGIWEQITDKFILSCGYRFPAGSTGGSETHTMTIKEMPLHSHGFVGDQSTHNHVSFVRDAEAEVQPENMYLVDTYATGDNALGWKPTLSPTTGKKMLTDIATITPSGEISESGDGESFSIMPPYLTVYTWKRIA